MNRTVNRIVNRTMERPIPVPLYNPGPLYPDGKQRITIYDTTLRDGEQMPGVAFDRDRKVKLALALADIGIEWIEAGFPRVSRHEAASIREVVEALSKEHPDRKVLVLARCRPADIEAAVEVGAHGVLLFSPASDIQIEAKGVDVESLPDMVREAAGLARKAGLWVSYSTEDSMRTPTSRLRALFKAAIQGGARRLGLTDTVGVATPGGMAYLVTLVRRWFPDLPVSVHCHNDHGLATANALAGVAAGATWVATTVAGVGERGGNVPLEEFVMAYEELYGGTTGIDTTKLKALSDMVCSMAGVRLQPHKPVVGEHAFAHESGLHAAAVRLVPGSYEPYPPELVGQTRHFVLGKHIGKRDLTEHLSTLGRTGLSSESIEGLAADIKTMAESGQKVDQRMLEKMVDRISDPGDRDAPSGRSKRGNRGNRGNRGKATRCNRSDIDDRSDMDELG